MIDIIDRIIQWDDPEWSFLPKGFLIDMRDAKFEIIRQRDINLRQVATNAELMPLLRDIYTSTRCDKTAVKVKDVIAQLEISLQKMQRTTQEKSE